MYIYVVLEESWSVYHGKRCYFRSLETFDNNIVHALLLLNLVSSYDRPT